ncbi:MAG: nicotinate mononucleotide-dependent phosphoribosyltransferase CobT [Candidatus Bathyarchaeota archaeon]
MKRYDFSIVSNSRKAKKFIENTEGKQPVFLCTIGTTETAKIPSLSAAGKLPELTDFTPSADVELLHYGRCKCIDGIPVTPEGIPTPAVITMSALKLGDIPLFVLNSGLRTKPHVPMIDFDGKYGADIRTGRAIDIEVVDKVFNGAKTIGRYFAKIADYLIIGESIPGGTTTALSLMLAMGINAKGKVSSSMSDNPYELKSHVAEDALMNAEIKFGELKKDPITALSKVGDPVVSVMAGVVLGATEQVPVMLAGGTQMGAVLAVVNAFGVKATNNVVIGTTKWITTDDTSDLRGIVSHIGDVPILSANLDFGMSNYSGLRAYESGVVKEGVGAGGSSIAAMLKSRGTITKRVLLKEIERNYKALMSCQHRSITLGTQGLK